MSDERTGRELTPADESQPPTPVPTTEQVAVERFSAGPRTHQVGLTEERGAQIVRQSGNARNIAFLAFLIIAIFIPVYWFYDLGVPALGVSGRMQAAAEEQQVTDIAQGYALYLANCARCHSTAANPGDGLGGVGPPLNSQMKLYNTITATGAAGTGHLNPNYLHNVLQVGGRYVCGDPNSVMPIWLQPGGPLNYREVEEVVAWITASSDVSFTYDPHSGHAAGVDPKATPYTVHGWRDPNFVPAPNASPVPACWRPYSNPAFATTATPPASLAPIANPGTPAAPRKIAVDLTSSLTIVDADGNALTSIPVKAGETVEFDVTNSAAFGHNFFVGSDAVLSKASGNIPGGTGIDEWTGPDVTQKLVWTVPTSETADLAYGCTLPGHYQSMHGTFVVQP